MRKTLCLLFSVAALLASSSAAAQTLRYPRLQLINAGSGLPQRFKLNIANGGCVDNPAEQRWDCTFGVGALQNAYNTGDPGAQIISQNSANEGIILQGYNGQATPGLSTTDYLGNQIAAFYTFGLNTFQLLGVSTSQAIALKVFNGTAAANGAQQYSPMLCQEGNGWFTGDLTGSKTVDFCWQTQPVQHLDNPTGTFKLLSKVGSGGYISQFSVDTSGTTSVTNLVATTAISAPAYETTLGANLGSAATITPTKAMHHITGTAMISTIATGSLPAGFVGCVDFIPDGAAGFATGGNIAKASTLVVGVINHTCFDGTSWYPAY